MSKYCVPDTTQCNVAGCPNAGLHAARAHLEGETVDIVLCVTHAKVIRKYQVTKPFRREVVN